MGLLAENSKVFLIIIYKFVVIIIVLDKDVPVKEEMYCIILNC